MTQFLRESEFGPLELIVVFRQPFLMFFIYHVMRSVKISCLLGIVWLGVLCSCRQQQQEDTSNRSYFSFDQNDKQLAIPVQLNDSVMVKLLFDTGDPLGYNHEFITLDTGILSANLSLLRNHVWFKSKYGVAWSERREQAIFYDSLHLKLKIGHTDFVYSGICAFPWKKYMNSNVTDGMFNIPKSDTAHIWELNFENNYMEVHSADSYNFPADCMVLPLEDSKYGPFYITFPLRLCFSDKDTLTIHQKFFIDTGLSRDIVLLQGTPEQEYLNQREDAVWLSDLSKYIRYYTATATLFDDFMMDSLRIYTLDYKNAITDQYLIGLNFLKRFNVFFDMKNKRLGLQPLRNFRRLVNPLGRRFYYSRQKSTDGKFIVDCVADYKENYYKEAGLQVGDEIVAIMGIPYGELTLETARILCKLDTLAVDIVRNGKPQTLYVKLDPNEPTGD